MPVALLAAAAAAAALPDKCDDLSYGNGSKQTALSWHFHYTWTTDQQSKDVSKFEAAFCKKWAKYGKSGTALSNCNFGPNNIGEDEQYVCHHGQCGSDDNDTVHNLEGDNVGAGRSCGSGACPSGGAHGPWSVCQGEFFVPVKHIDELAAWVADNALSLDIMRHPNTGCQWGDHSVRAEWLSGKWGLGPGSLPGEPSLAGPEMCLWGLPCNNVGYGCVQGMCGSGNGKREKQHCSGCTMLAH